MARYIDADKLSKMIEARADTLIEGKEAFLYISRWLNLIPAADVVEAKRGEWEVCSDEYEICASEFVCSNCKESFVSSDLTDEQFFEMMKYCPNCGAKMDGERKGE